MRYLRHTRRLTSLPTNLLFLNDHLLFYKPTQKHVNLDLDFVQILL